MFNIKIISSFFIFILGFWDVPGLLTHVSPITLGSFPSVFPS